MTTQLHVIIVYNGHDLSDAKQNIFDVGDDPVLYIRLCKKNNNIVTSCVYLGEVPGTINNTENTPSHDYFMQYGWNDGIKFIQSDTIDSKTTDHSCILSAVVAIELK